MLNSCSGQTGEVTASVFFPECVRDKVYNYKLIQCEVSSQAPKVLATDTTEKDAGPKKYYSVAKRRSGQRY